MSYLKIAAAVGLIVAVFCAGYKYAAALYGKDIADLRADYATRAAALEETYREKEKGNAEAIAAAWEERDRARAVAADLTGELERVRVEADAARRELSRVSDDPCHAYRAKLARSTEIIERGAALVERCVRFSSDTASDKDAMSNILTAPSK